MPAAHGDGPPGPVELIRSTIARISALATGRSYEEYARLPHTLSITSTQSSSDSYYLGDNSDGLDWQDAAKSRWHSVWSAVIPTTSPSRKPHHAFSDNEQSVSPLELWKSHKRRVVQGAVAVAATVFIVSSTYSLTRSNTPILDLASVSSCEALPWDEVGWFKHSTVSSNSKKSSSHADEKRLSAQPLKFQSHTSQACADSWVARGELCSELLVQAGSTGLDASDASVLGDMDVDVTWSFVEPTPYWRKWELAYKGESPNQAAEGSGSKFFRSYDEIRYSVRSVVQNLPFVRKMTLLATTLPAVPPPAEGLLANETASFSQESACRVAQMPEWMNMDTVKLSPALDRGDASAKLEMLSQWEQFDAQTANTEEALAWKHDVLPTFNSHSIESQLYNLPDPAEAVLYLNNDCYIGRPLLPSDMSTHLFGPVFRIYPHSWSTGAATEEEAMLLDGEGNARVLPNTIRHLDNRFGRRDRNYPEHVGYVLPTAMMDEVAQVWPEELKETASVRFRGRGPEVWLPLLTMYYLIEKHREATSWSFLVARADIDGSGTYALSERQAMLADLGGERDGDILRFPTPKRTWDDSSHKQALQDAGITVPIETRYYWTAANGYPYVSGEEGNHIFPTYDGENPNFCAMSISDAFGRPGFFDDDGAKGDIILQPEDLLKRVAFEKTKVGDCILAALLAQSGERGFEAFLPRREAPPSALQFWRHKAADTRNEVPLIGGWTKIWRETKFALKDVLPKGWERRDFAVRLVQRYTYAFGETSTAFNELNNDLGWINWFLWRWSEDRGAFMALNDHVTTKNETLQGLIRERVADFHNQMWPNATIYELPGA